MSTIYDPNMIELVTTRGYDHAAHQAALAANDENAIALTHPANWMTEFEVEICTTLDTLIHDGLVETVP